MKIQAPVDFVIVTALEEECNAVLKRLPNFQQVPPSKEDVRVYYAGELPATFSDRSTCTYSVIVMPLLSMGQTNAATATSDAIRRWRPRYVLLVGIAGGISERGVCLGDVLISDQIVDYENQKLMPNGPEVRCKVYQADARLHGAAENDRKWFKKVRVSTKRPKKGSPQRLIGPIATGNKVVASKDALRMLLNKWPKLIGVEMEAGGVASACFQAVERPGFLMVRGVSDLADAQKDSAAVQKWRQYACEIAASYAISLLKNGLIPPLDQQGIPQLGKFFDKALSYAISPFLRRLIAATRSQVAFGSGRPEDILPLDQQGIPQLGKFFGREEKITELKNALTDDANPLALLTSIVGGTGKTALALQVASILEGEKIFEAVIWTTSKDQPLTLVNLLDAIARVLHFPYIIQLEPHLKEEAIRKELPKKRCLLLVDNFETITEAEISKIRRFLISLPAPTKALITSRTIVFEERAHIIKLEGLDQKSAIALIKDAAALIQLSCQDWAKKEKFEKENKFDKLYAATAGMPMAIKWAIPLIKELVSFDRVLQKLNDAKDKMFEDMFEYMFGQFWQLLNDDERLLLKIPSIFAAPVSRAALHAVSDLTGDIFDDEVQRLRKLNLLDADEHNLDNEYKPRFFLHPLTRAFVSKHLDQTPELITVLRERLVRYFVNYIERFGGSVEQERWEKFDRLEEERVNLLAVLDWCYSERQKVLLLLLLQGISRYLFVYGHWQHRLEHCWRAIELLTGVRDRDLEQLPAPDSVVDIETKRHLAWLLRDIGRVYTNQGKYKASHTVLTRALAFAAQNADDIPEVAFVQFHLGELAFQEGDYAQAEQWWQKSLHLNEQIEGTRHIIGVTYWLGVLAYKQGALEKAKLTLDENLHRCEEEKWERLIAYHLNYLGNIALQKIDYDHAHRCYDQGYKIVKNRDTRCCALLELSFARLEEAEGHFKNAIKWVDKATRHFHFLGMDKEKQEADELSARLKASIKN